MTLEQAKAELEKFVKLKTTQRPAFVDVLLEAEEPVLRCKDCVFYWYKNLNETELPTKGIALRIVTTGEKGETLTNTAAELLMGLHWIMHSEKRKKNMKGSARRSYENQQVICTWRRMGCGTRGHTGGPL